MQEKTYRADAPHDAQAHQPMEEGKRLAVGLGAGQRRRSFHNRFSLRRGDGCGEGATRGQHRIKAGARNEGQAAEHHGSRAEVCGAAAVWKEVVRLCQGRLQYRFRSAVPMGV